MKEVRIEWATMMNKAVLDMADAPVPLGWKKQCGRRCWSICITLAVERAASMMMRRPSRVVESSILRLRRGLETWIFPRDKAARRENPEADALWCVCQSCATILWLRRKRRCSRAHATTSMLPQLASEAVWKRKCDPQQFNDVWALMLLRMRAFLVPTTEDTSSSAGVYTLVGQSFRCIGSACSWRRGQENLGGIGQRWLEHVELVRKMRCRDRGEGDKLCYRLARREISWALGFVICWMDQEPVVRSLETAAIRSLRPNANKERTLKRRRAVVERHRPLPGFRRNAWVSAPHSILVTCCKSKPCTTRVLPESNPSSWIWLAGFRTLYAFEQRRWRPYHGPVSIIEDEMAPLLVLWLCHRGSVVDWHTLYEKAQSRRPLLRSTSLLSFVMSPSRRSVGAARVSRELQRQGLPDIRPFTVEVSVSEAVAFTKTAWRERVMPPTHVLTKRHGYDDKSGSERRRKINSWTQ